MTNPITKAIEVLEAYHAQAQRHGLNAPNTTDDLISTLRELEKQEPFGYLMPHCYDGHPVFMRHPLPSAHSAEIAITTLYTAPSVPDGFVLVPKEPTEEMLRAMVDPFIAVDGDNRAAFNTAYRSMLSAAPSGQDAEHAAMYRWLRDRWFYCGEGDFFIRQAVCPDELDDAMRKLLDDAVRELNSAAGEPK